jgi:hypothetical protein
MRDDLEGPVFRVEVRSGVVAVVHRDHDAQEPRDLRHALLHLFVGPTDSAPAAGDASVVRKIKLFL